MCVSRLWRKIKGYRLRFLEPINTKFIISRDVICNESSFPYLSSTNKVAKMNKKVEDTIIPSTTIAVDSGSKVEQ